MEVPEAAALGGRPVQRVGVLVQAAHGVRGRIGAAVGRGEGALQARGADVFRADGGGGEGEGGEDGHGQRQQHLKHRE